MCGVNPSEKNGGQEQTGKALELNQHFFFQKGKGKFGAGPLEIFPLHIASVKRVKVKIEPYRQESRIARDLAFKFPFHGVTT